MPKLTESISVTEVGLNENADPLDLGRSREVPQCDNVHFETTGKVTPDPYVPFTDGTANDNTPPIIVSRQRGGVIGSMSAWNPTGEWEILSDFSNKTTLSASSGIFGTPDFGVFSRSVDEYVEYFGNVMWSTRPALIDETLHNELIDDILLTVAGSVIQGTDANATVVDFATLGSPYGIKPHLPPPGFYDAGAWDSASGTNVLDIGGSNNIGGTGGKWFVTFGTSADGSPYELDLAQVDLKITVHVIDHAPWSICEGLNIMPIYTRTPEGFTVNASYAGDPYTVDVGARFWQPYRPGVEDSETWDGVSVEGFHMGSTDDTTLEFLIPAGSFQVVANALGFGDGLTASGTTAQSTADAMYLKKIEFRYTETSTWRPGTYKFYKTEVFDPGNGVEEEGPPQFMQTEILSDNMVTFGFSGLGDAGTSGEANLYGNIYFQQLFTPGTMISGRGLIHIFEVYDED